ncbi:MAG: ATP-binding protein [Desulfamplus sp.]|nr:ATP-binding protein [Desulfamplus sp.]
MKPWFKIVKPHKDIQDGHLDESIFAADLAEVAQGRGREIYTDPEIFFKKTCFTAGIKNIAKRVVQGLSGKQDSDNRVISLQTGFGGGKTHTLISLFHLAKWGKKAGSSEYTKELLSVAGEPTFDSANIAVFTNKTNDPAQGRQVDGFAIKTLWGELAYQLGGKEAYQIIQVNDERQIAPKGLFKKILEQCKPALILIDELADYCVSASAVKVGASNLSDQTISFMQELTEAVSGTDQCVMIATLPASAQEVASSPISSQILAALEHRITRVGSNLKPVEDDEIFEVIRRRLFEDLGNSDEIKEVISAYSGFYKSMFTEIPKYASQSEYFEKLKKSYPFHPELIDMFRLRWASNPYFQRTRGVLRILAAIVSDLWKRQNSLTGSQFLIHTSNVVLSNVEAITSQITMLNGASWDSVINADVSGSSSNAFRIDNEIKQLGNNNITQGIASTILLGTFGSKGQNKGVSIDEIKLCMITSEGFNHNDINNAIDRMEANAHYLYFSTTGSQKRYWFDTTPNINILINQAKGDINKPDIMAEIIKRVKEKTKAAQFFNVLVDPSEDIPEQIKPTLVILSPKYLANSHELSESSKRVVEKIATKKGNNDRIYRNTIIFLVCSEIGFSKLQDNIRNYLACNKINQDYSSQLTKEQKADIHRRIDDAGKDCEHSLVLAYSVLVKYSVKNGIESLIVKQSKDNFQNYINSDLISTLKEEEWLLDSIGLNKLRSSNLLPTQDYNIKAKDIYDAFLRFDDKPMVTGQEAVAKSILKYCYNGEYCIAAGENGNFTKFFFKENVPFFDINDTTYWLVDKSLKPQPLLSNIDRANYDDKKGSKDISEETVENSVAERENISTNRDHVKPNIDDAIKKLKSLTVSGRVPLEHYTELFNYFIAPFAMSGNKIDIEVKFKIKSTESSPIDESKQQYKSVKEAAKQLNLNFEEDV